MQKFSTALSDSKTLQFPTGFCKGSLSFIIPTDQLNVFYLALQIFIKVLDNSQHNNF